MDENKYKVVKNHENQFSIWPAEMSAPSGWKEEGIQGSKDECLQYIDKHWSDMRPKSLIDRA